eukprot:gene2923-3189_t
MSFLKSIVRTPIVHHLFPSSVWTISPTRGFHSMITSSLTKSTLSPSLKNSSDFNLILNREMNRNARRPKKANHGKRPCSHARRRAKRDMIKSVAYRKKIFGFW